jgi:transcriptional regulator with XRE-family HTH domain
MADNVLGDYLRARRELIRPEERGLPDLGRRRVPGLRREEVAMLAGISAEYYVRLERGRDRHPSAQVLDALSRVLGLDDESHDYLASLAGLAGPARRAAGSVPPAVHALLAGTRAPAFVLGRFMDVLASNAAADRLHGGMPGNIVRHLFLDPSSRQVYPDWADVAAEAVASLRSSVAGHLDDPRLTQLVGELSLKSPEFGALWARHDVRAKTSGSKRIRSPEIGDVTVHWGALEVPGAPGQIVVTYFAEAGSDSRSRLDRLGTAPLST